MWSPEPSLAFSTLSLLAEVIAGPGVFTSSEIESTQIRKELHRRQ